jgi:uncharacterized membrane protein
VPVTTAGELKPTQPDLGSTAQREQAQPPEVGDPTEARGDGPSGWGRRFGAGALSALRRLTVWHLGLLVAMVLYVIWFTSLTLDIHHGLGTSSFDLGLYDQGVWLLSRFEAPFVTLMGRNLFGDHTSFILLFLVPLYWLWPSVGVLLFIQSVVLAAGAIPVFMYARRRLPANWMAFVCGIAYLCHPAVGWTNVENFHPDAFAGVLVGFAVYGALERKWRVYAVFVVLALMVKEDVALVIAPLGVWVALRRDRRIGIITILGSLAFAAYAILVVMRTLTGVVGRNVWRIPFGGPFGLLRRLVSHPGEVWDHLRSDGRPYYLWQMTAPFAFVFARLPDVALISALVLFTNVLSTFAYQYDIHYHYSLIAVPALALGSVYALRVMRARWRTAMVLLMGVTAFYASYLWGAFPYSRHDFAYWAPDHPIAADLRAIIDEIPSDASVAAFHSAAPHLSHRREIYQFPTPFRAVLYGSRIEVEGTRLADRAEDVDFVLLPTSLDETGAADFATIAPAFDLVAHNDGWNLYERDRSVSLPPLPPPP